MVDSISSAPRSLRLLQAVNVVAIAAYTASTFCGILNRFTWNSKDSTLTPGLEFAFARLFVVVPLVGFAGYQFSAQACTPIRTIGYRLAALAVFSSLFNDAFDFGAYHSAVALSLVSALIASDITRVLRPLTLDAPVERAFIRAPFWAWHAWSLVSLGFAPSNLHSLGHPSPIFFVACVLWIIALVGSSVWYAYDMKRGGDVPAGAIMLWYAIELCCYHRVKSIQIAGIIGSIISGLALVFTVVQSIRTASDEGRIRLAGAADERLAPVAAEGV